MKISKRDKKILTVGALAVVLIFVVTYVIVPFIESEMDIRERTQQKEMVLQKYEKIMNQRDEVEKELDQLRGKQNKLKKRLLKGSTPSLAAAEMQKVLEKISKKHELELKSVKVKDEEEKGEFLAIPLEVRLITDLNRTRKFLADLEKNAKCLVIPKLKISVKNQRDPKEVIVTLVVTGFFIKKGVEKKEV
ncbi:MAG: type 4a pilus biogenesis protein PilO [Deltaproteobacteria bacterium]|nr:type 4a pilus biogenesis protein PilO [Deltaproteobacteria bacterium]